ncbi:MAG: response regulator transcription factor [Candidatus Dormibacteraeota bacterium]|nr:response regulator transcription factor [Candidatus Dormibacteraeota bacterium]
MVVDDERPARTELVFLLRSTRLVGQVDEAADAAACLALLEQHRYDVVFLDVRMPGLDGIALSRVIQRGEEPPRIVVVSAYEEYALDAFGVAAFDYLVKPVRRERLLMTLKRLQGEVTLRTTAGGVGGEQNEAGIDRLAVTSKGRILLVGIDEIRVAEIDGPRVYVYTAEGRYPSRLKFKAIEERLAGRGFLRVHRRYLVNLNHVRAIETFFNGTYLLRINGLANLSIPVSRRHGSELRSMVSL